MMKKIFKDQIGDMIELDMDYMIVKSNEETNHTLHIEAVLRETMRHNMHLNLYKFKFSVKFGKLFSYNLTETE